MPLLSSKNKIINDLILDGESLLNDVLHNLENGPHIELLEIFKNYDHWDSAVKILLKEESRSFISSRLIIPKSEFFGSERFIKFEYSEEELRFLKDVKMRIERRLKDLKSILEKLPSKPTLNKVFARHDDGYSVFGKPLIGVKRESIGFVLFETVFTLSENMSPSSEISFKDILIFIKKHKIKIPGIHYLKINSKILKKKLKDNLLNGQGFLKSKKLREYFKGKKIKPVDVFRSLDDNSIIFKNFE